MIPTSRVILGTAQLGNAYGLFAESETSEAAKSRINAALERGFTRFDTAPGYGLAETLLGETLPEDASIITKTPHLASELSTAEVEGSFRECLDKSLTALQRSDVEGLLLHTPQRLSPQIAEILQKLKGESLVQKVGVSVYTAEEIASMLTFWTPDIVQLPASLIDQRLISSGLVDTLIESGVEVHIRSVFLQGVLLSAPDALPSHLEGLKPAIRALQQEAAAQGVSPAALCLGFLHARLPSARIIVGLQSNQQLKELELALQTGASPLKSEEFSIEDPLLVNPANWS